MQQQNEAEGLNHLDSKLDYAQLIFRQTQKVMDSDGQGESFLTSVKLLESLISFYIDDEYIKLRQKLDEQEEKDIKRWGALERHNRDEYVQCINEILIRYHLDIFQLIMNLLGRRGLTPKPIVYEN